MTVALIIFAILAIASICLAAMPRRAQVRGDLAQPAPAADTPPASCTHGLQAAVPFDDSCPSETFIRARWDVVDVTRQGNRIAVEYIPDSQWARLNHPQSESDHG